MTWRYQRIPKSWSSSNTQLHTYAESSGSQGKPNLTGVSRDTRELYRLWEKKTIHRVLLRQVTFFFITYFINKELCKGLISLTACIAKAWRVSNVCYPNCATKFLEGCKVRKKTKGKKKTISIHDTPWTGVSQCAAFLATCINSQQHKASPLKCSPNPKSLKINHPAS